MRCAYLTTDEIGDLASDAEASIRPMAALGWDVEMVPWRRSTVDWTSYDAVYLCTPWDYFDAFDEFLGVLADIEASGSTLVNPPALLRWGLAKTYLRDLQARGAAIVPSDWYDDFPDTGARTLFRSPAANKVVIKPVVGANAVNTFVLQQPLEASLAAKLRQLFAGQPFFVQPFMENIVSEGEYSLVFFDGEFSHAILKVPAAGDFRVQEEHGAEIRPVEPRKALIRIARQTLALVDPMPVYARLDYVRDSGECYLLMELEVAEPSLYLRMDDRAATRFAQAVDAYVRLQRSAR